MPETTDALAADYYYGLVVKEYDEEKEEMEKARRARGHKR